MTLRHAGFRPPTRCAQTCVYSSLPDACLITSYVLAASQIISRLFTFGLSLATARSLTPEAYGVRHSPAVAQIMSDEPKRSAPIQATAGVQVATVQFHLINTSILFISREGFRRGCLRVDQGQPGAAWRVLRTASLTLPVGVILAAIITGLLLRSVGADDPIYSRALIMQGEFRYASGSRSLVNHACARPGCNSGIQGDGVIYPVAVVQVWQLF